MVVVGLEAMKRQKENSVQLSMVKLPGQRYGTKTFAAAYSLHKMLKKTEYLISIYQALPYVSS